MTTIAALVAAAPAPDRGVPTQIVNGSGVWRHVVEIADPAAGSAIVWHDITDHFTGYDYTRGADTYQGRYRASVATLDLFADDDSLAPWNTDTSPTFGVHVKLGPGLLVRSGFIRVVDDAVAEWNPRFTNKVEEWGDAAYSKGRVRQHRIVARDTMTSLVAVPLPATSEENWSDRMFHFLTDSGWPYGSAIYGAQFEVDTTTPILVLPDRPAASSAANELDAILDPVGLVWYTNRLGQLVVRPTVYDTFHADAFAAGATGDQWPSDVTPVAFAWWACSDPTAGAVAYAVDQLNSFGLDETERSVINHVRVVAPTGTFDDDDPISIQRYDPHTFQASWMAENDVVAGDLLAFRANATVEARPLHTTLELPGFHHGADTVDFLGYIAIDHRNRDDGLAAYANGYLRNYVEQVTPRGCDVDWGLTITVDVYNVESDAGLLPVEDLTLVDVTDTTAEFSWTNPAQTITPTHTQLRILNPASIWATVAYPITGVIWNSLEPSTGYEFQVRLIRVVDGLITHVSPSRSLTFVTDTTTVPDIIGVGDDGDTDVEFPPPVGPCDTIDWELQESADGSTGWTMIDSGTISEPPWEVTIPDVVYDGDKFYRVVADACGDVTVSNLFVGHCTDPPALGIAPFNDADCLFYFPAICPPDTLVEAFSEQPASKGFQYDDFVTDGDGNVVLVSLLDGIVAYAANPVRPFDETIATLTGDATIACKVLVTHQPDAAVILFHAAGLILEAVANGAKWSVNGHCVSAGGGITNVVDSTLLDFGAWYDLAITHDTVSGDVILYVDGSDRDTAAGVDNDRHNAGYYQVGVPEQSLITNSAVWDRVLADTELPGYVATTTFPDTVLTYTPLSYWMFRGNDADTLNDFGTLSHDLTNVNAVALNNEAGDDGFNYPDTNGTSDDRHLAAADDIGYEPVNTSGLTIMFLFKNTSGQVGAVHTINKIDSTGAGSWYIDTEPSTGFIQARTVTSGGSSARTRTITAGLATSGWTLVFVRFGGSAGDIPAIRIAGTNRTGSTSGSGSINTDSPYPVRLFGHGGSASHPQCALAHVAVYAGQLSDANSAILEAAAIADGWSI